MSVITAGPGRPHILLLRGPLSPFYSLWRHRLLIGRLAWRDFEARYRGSALGALWAALNPLLMLAVYGFVFSTIMVARWNVTPSADAAPGAEPPSFVLILFSGLVVFGLLSECVTRAPMLILERQLYVQKVIFPIEILPWSTLLVALLNTFIAFLTLLAAHLLLRGVPPAATLLVPLAVLPLAIGCLGLIWLLASLGVFLRDLGQFMGFVVTALMFLSPVLYPSSAVPERYRSLVSLNPLTGILERVRGLMFFDQPFGWADWAVELGCACIMAWFGYAWFMRSRKAFADVL